MGHLKEAIQRKQAVDFGKLSRKVINRIRHGKPRKPLGQLMADYKRTKPITDAAGPVILGTGTLAAIVAGAKADKNKDKK